MQKAPPDEEDRASVRSSGRMRSPLSKASASTNGRRLEELAEEDAGYEEHRNGGIEIRSDVQEANGSDIARTIPIHTTGLPEHEPGPDDPPGPHFESYGSSFGNFGPLPPGPAPWNNGQTNAPLSPIDTASFTSSHPNPFQQFGMTPATAAGVPLPASVASPSVHTRPISTKAQSVADAGANGANGANGIRSPKAQSRVLSPARTGGERPWSPRSVASHGQSLKSRNTQKTQRTVYPPLPESMMEETASQRPPSPQRSIAPSESASQMTKSRYRAPTTKEPSQKARSVRSTTEVNAIPQQGAAAEYYAEVRSQRDGRSQAPMSQGPMSQVAMSQGPISQAAMSPHSYTSQVPPLRTAATNEELQRAAAAALSPTRSKRSNHDPEATPTPSRPTSPVMDLDADEQRMVHDLLSRPSRSRTSFALSTMAPSALEPEIQNSHFHDMELCQLLHALDQPMGEPVKKAVRKAVRTRVKKLGMKYDNESIKQYRKSYHDHDPSVHLNAALNAIAPSSRRSTQLGASQEPPEWAKDLIDGMINMRERLDILAPKIEKSLRSSRGDSYVAESRGYLNGHHHHHYSHSEMNGGYTQSPMTQTVNIHTQPSGTMGDDSMFQPGETELLRESTNLHTLPGSMHHHDGSVRGAIPEEDMYEDEDDLHLHDGDPRGMGSRSDYMPTRAESPGQQYLEEELYKLRVKPTGSQSGATHKTWEVARDDGEDYDDEDVQAAVTESGMPEIPDTNTGVYTDRRASPPLPPIPHDSRADIVMPEPQVWQPGDYSTEPPLPPPWQRVHQRLLSWAIVWPMAELDNALNSTTRGMQVDEVALSIWSTQTYKRYVRAKMTDTPRGRVDRLFVPPNMADAISTAVYNGRHGDACGMLRDLWAPFGLEGIPRLLVVLAKHRNDENHWVVHRFSLPDGSLTTYDTFPERCLPDGRPLGWWFAIRIAWPDAIYPSPDHLMQKMVRLHRPLQLPIDNSVAAAGIWRNLLMGSRAERSLDLERLRDLMNTEVKNLRQRKVMGKLSIGSPKPNWEDMH
ncbi:hypothetical protein BKA93DRAFT_17945 [Sparassis latifolia]